MVILWRGSQATGKPSVDSPCHLCREMCLLGSWGLGVWSWKGSGSLVTAWGSLEGGKSPEMAGQTQRLKATLPRPPPPPTLPTTLVLVEAAVSKTWSGKFRHADSHGLSPLLRKKEPAFYEIAVAISCESRAPVGYESAVQVKNRGWGYSSVV